MPSQRSPIPALAGAPLLAALVAAPTSAPSGDVPAGEATPHGPYVVVLGIAQDGGYPQAGTKEAALWEDADRRRLVSSLGLVDPVRGKRWLFDATPDFPEQLHRLDRMAPDPDIPGLDGIFLTHGHMGHYTGLLHLGREAIGARGVVVWAMPRMARFLRDNGPWEQLVRLGNVVVEPLADGRRVDLGDGLGVTPLAVPHRDEYTETVGFRITGPERSVLFVPDVDKWERWGDDGRRLERELSAVDVAYLDGTFYADGEIPGRAMGEIPHPFVEETVARLREQPAAVRSKVRFIHLNRTNPALEPGGAAERAIEAAGLAVARELERVAL